jgi:hypothetical protein
MKQMKVMTRNDDAQDDNEDETTSSRGKSKDLVVMSIKYDAHTNAENMQ